MSRNDDRGTCNITYYPVFKEIENRATWGNPKIQIVFIVKKSPNL